VVMAVERDETGDGWKRGRLGKTIPMHGIYRKNGEMSYLELEG